MSFGGQGLYLVLKYIEPMMIFQIPCLGSLLPYSLITTLNMVSVHK